MASSAILVAKRAFVSVLLALGCAYRLAFTINRDSDDADILRSQPSINPDTRTRKVPGDRTSESHCGVKKVRSKRD